ncbi:FecR family protein [Chitinophaga sp.]|uniref:FecR family protein n=1 Tax=Chitinophaga sp. TaxID=1869181 RepID=UPI002639A36B|nr:FecR family protein [uncultured Chitinophaga sp.]
MENENHIRLLLHKELFGTITPEEQQSLDDLMATSAKARAIRSEMRDNESYGGQAFPSQQLESDYLAVLQRHRRRRLQRIWNWWISAGLAAGAIITVLFVWPAELAPVATPSVIPSSIQEVTLQFANGETVTFHEGNPQRYRVQATGFVFNDGMLRLENVGHGASGWNSFSVPPGKESRVQLPDGTEVHLNSASKIIFPFRFGPGPREVYLEGEAYFRIRNGHGEAFIIHAGQADLTSRGAGICNVNAYTPTSVAAHIVNGPMEMSAFGSAIPLQGGQEATAATGRPLYPARMQSQHSLSWTTGEQLFRDLPAMELRNIIARWFNTTLYIDTEEAEKKLLNGSIHRNQTLSEFVDNINAQNEVEFYWKNGMLHCR